jgi:hypothetical protein
MNYVNGARYPFFSTCAGGLILCGAIRILHFPPFAVKYIVPAVVGWAVVSKTMFLYQKAPAVWPDLFLSHATIWRAVINETEQSIREGSPVRDIYFPSLGEFGFEAKRYEVLIKYQLGLPPGHRLDWTEKQEQALQEFAMEATRR